MSIPISVHKVFLLFGSGPVFRYNYIIIIYPLVIHITICSTIICIRHLVSILLKYDNHIKKKTIYTQLVGFADVVLVISIVNKILRIIMNNPFVKIEYIR